MVAAEAANAVAELYIEGQKKAKGLATSEANAWLDQRVREVHQEVIQAQQKRDEFRRQAGIIELGEMSINAEQLADMNSRLIEARTVRQQAEARYAQVAKLTQSSAALESCARGALLGTDPDLAATADRDRAQDRRAGDAISRRASQDGAGARGAGQCAG